MNTKPLVTGRQLGYLVVAFLLLLLSISVYTFLTRVGKTRVDVVVLPRDSSITVNGQSISAGENYLKPGSYIFVAKRKDFNSFTFKQTVGDKPVTVNLLPEATSAAALLYLKNNPQVQGQREAIADQEIQKAGQARLAKYPFFNQLPIIYDHGNSSIGSGPSITKPDDKAVIVKDIFSSGRAADLEVMRQSGFNPADYIVEFPDFTNPLIDREAGD